MDFAEEEGWALYRQATHHMAKLQEQHPIVLLAFVLPIMMIAIGLLAPEGKSSKRPRKMSFTSGHMAAGSFPTDTHMPEAIINVAFYFKDCPSVEQLQETAKLITLYSNFRSIPVREKPSLLGAVPMSWKEVPVDVAKHVIDHYVDDDEGVKQQINQLKELSLGGPVDGAVHPSSIPLWRFHRIKNGSSKGGTGEKESVVLFTCHHCIADGIGLVGVCNRIFKDLDGNPPVDLELAKKMNKEKSGSDGRGRGGRRGRGMPSMYSPVFWWKMLTGLVQVVTLGMSRFDTETPFSHQRCSTDDDGEKSGGGKPATAAAAGKKGKKKAVLHRKKAGTLGFVKREVIYFPFASLAAVKSISRAASATVNDVLLSVISGTIRRYCAAQQPEVFAAAANDSPDKSPPWTGGRGGEKVQVRALIPVALPRHPPPSDLERGLRNRWSLQSVGTGFEQTDAIARIQTVHRIMNQVKTSPVAFIQIALQNYIMDKAPRSLSSQMTLDVFERHSFVFSNIPGPNKPVVMAGHEVQRIQVMFPNILPQLTLLSYNGNIALNAVLDTQAIPDAQSLVEHYRQEWKEVCDKLGETSPLHE